MMPEAFHPAELFVREQPELAARARAAVHDWFDFTLDTMTDFFPQHIRSVTGAVLNSADITPQDAYIHGWPLQYAIPEKRQKLAAAVNRRSKAEYTATFLTWRYHNFYATESEEVRSETEDVAARHIFFWLRAALPEHPEYKNMFETIEPNLRAYSRDRNLFVQFESAEFLGCIQSAIIEEFISYTYAPPDLFGAVL